MTRDIRSLLHFVVVAEEMSFTRAAARLGIAQPWLSQRIRLLEDQLGKPLFTRTTRRIELTDAGQALFAAAASLTTVMANVNVTVSDFRRVKSEPLRIGGPPYGSRVAVRNEFLKELAAAGGDLTMEVEVGWSPHLCRRVREGELDAAFAVSPLDEPTLDILQIGKLQRLFVFADGDPLRQAGMVRAAELAERKVAVFPRGANPALFDRAFQPLIDAGVELIPIEFNGHVLAEGKRPGPLIQSFFGNPVPDPARGERLLAESEAIAFNFVTRDSDRRPLVEAARQIARRLGRSSAKGSESG